MNIKSVRMLTIFPTIVSSVIDGIPIISYVIEPDESENLEIPIRLLTFNDFLENDKVKQYI